MAWTPFVGASLGFFVTCYKNGLCQMRWNRRPWEHVIAAATGAYVCTWVVEKEEQMIEQIEEHYAKLDAKSA